MPYRNAAPHTDEESFPTEDVDVERYTVCISYRKAGGATVANTTLVIDGVLTKNKIASDSIVTAHEQFYQWLESGKKYGFLSISKTFLIKDDLVCDLNIKVSELIKTRTIRNK